MPTPEQIKAAADRLGLPEEAVAKLFAALLGDEGDGGSTPTTPPAPPEPPAPTSPPAPSPTVPPASTTTAADLARVAAATGAVLIDPSQLDEMRRMAALGQEAHNTLRIRERDEIINQAIKDGKIAPSRTQHWTTYWDSDPEGARDALKKLSPNLIPVEVRGYAGTSMATSETEAAYKGLYGEEG
jgi:hypothetical protein